MIKHLRILLPLLITIALLWVTPSSLDQNIVVGFIWSATVASLFFVLLIPYGQSDFLTSIPFPFGSTEIAIKYPIFVLLVGLFGAIIFTSKVSLNTKHLLVIPEYKANCYQANLKSGIRIWIDNNEVPSNNITIQGDKVKVDLFDKYILDEVNIKFQFKSESCFLSGENKTQIGWFDFIKTSTNVSLSYSCDLAIEKFNKKQKEIDSKINIIIDYDDCLELQKEFDELYDQILAKNSDKRLFSVCKKDLQILSGKIDGSLDKLNNKSKELKKQL